MPKSLGKKRREDYIIRKVFSIVCISIFPKRLKYTPNPINNMRPSSCPISFSSNCYTNIVKMYAQDDTSRLPNKFRYSSNLLYSIFIKFAEDAMSMPM